MAFDWVAAATIGAGLLGADAASNAADQQAQAANQAGQTSLAASKQSIDAQKAMFDTLNAQSAPWRQAGSNALDTIAGMQPQFTHSFDANDLKTNLAPNYQFQLDQGLGATKNAANLQTGLVSGNALRGINNYAQDYAGNAYQQAYNNYNANQTNIFNRLSNIAGLGQTANANITSVGGTVGSNIGNTITSGGQGMSAAQMAAGAAGASGTVGTANALSGGLTNGASWYSLPQILKGFNSGGGRYDWSGNSSLSNLGSNF